MKIRIASTERIAAFRAIQDGIRSAAASNFALAAMIDADSRGAKAQATEDGLPHGQYAASRSGSASWSMPEPYSCPPSPRFRRTQPTSSRPTTTRGQPKRRSRSRSTQPA